MKKLNNKGFTLIEIVIVIVIIAILAAMLVPSLTSWIDNSKQKSFVEGANSIKTACLSQLSTNYAEKNSFTIGDSDIAAVKALAGDGVEIGKIEKGSGKATQSSASGTYNVKIDYDATAKTVSAISVANDTYNSTYTSSKNSWETTKFGS